MNVVQALQPKKKQGLMAGMSGDLDGVRSIEAAWVYWKIKACGEFDMFGHA